MHDQEPCSDSSRSDQEYSCVANMTCSKNRIPRLKDKVVVNRSWVLTALRQQLHSTLGHTDYPIREKDLVDLYKQQTGEELSELSNALSYKTVAGMLQSLELSGILETEYIMSQADSDQRVILYKVANKTQARREFKEKPPCNPKSKLPKCISSWENYGNECARHVDENVKGCGQKLSREPLLELRYSFPPPQIVDRLPTPPAINSSTDCIEQEPTQSYDDSAIIFEPFEVEQISEYEQAHLAYDYQSTFKENVQKVAMLISFIVMYRQTIELSDLDEEIEDLFGRCIRATELLEPNWSSFVKKYCWQVEISKKDGKEIQLVWNDRQMTDQFAEFCSSQSKTQYKNSTSTIGPNQIDQTNTRPIQVPIQPANRLECACW